MPGWRSNRSSRVRWLGRSAACTAIAVIALAPSLGAAVEQSAARKLGRGLAGMTCGFLEIPGNIVDVSRERGAAAGWTLGFVLGLGKLVVRELVGVYEFVSAPFEIPAGFQPIIEPEFPWSYFDDPGSTPRSYPPN